MRGVIATLLFLAAVGAVSRNRSATDVTAESLGKTNEGIAPVSAYVCPSSHPIKGNFTTYSGERCIAHSPGGEFYSKTKPEKCYATPADAAAEGCRASRR